MKYRKIGGGGQIAVTESFDVPTFDFITLTSRGHLTLQKGFTWDGVWSVWRDNVLAVDDISRVNLDTTSIQTNIGENLNNIGHVLNGIIDQLYIYHRQITIAEGTALYNEYDIDDTVI